MISDRSLTAVNSPNFLVTFSNEMYGFDAGSAQGAKLRRMLSSDSIFPLQLERAERPRQLPARAFVASLAGDDLGPDARHRALCLGVVRRNREELLHRRLIGIDCGIAENILVDELLRGLVAVGVEHVVRRLGRHLG